MFRTFDFWVELMFPMRFFWIHNKIIYLGGGGGKVLKTAVLYGKSEFLTNYYMYKKAPHSWLC